MTHPTNELSWWIDHTGSTHTHVVPKAPPAESIAAGKIYLDAKAGVITHLHNKPADLSFVSRELLDVLHRQFPGTRWWIKDPSPAHAPTHQTAS